MARMTKKKAASILEGILYLQECNSSWINEDCDADIAQEWKERKQALEIAIRNLKR